jgi:hypothetical protein
MKRIRPAFLAAIALSALALTPRLEGLVDALDQVSLPDIVARCSLGPAGLPGEEAEEPGDGSIVLA